jgi:uncharacterized protein YegL
MSKFNKQQQLILAPHKTTAQPCSFYARGKCKKGAACNFAHVGASAVNTTTRFVQQSGTGAKKSKIEVVVSQKSGSKGQPATQGTPMKKAAYFVVDTSGSMAGERAAAAAKGVLEVQQRVLTDKDVISLYTFSDETVVRFQHKHRTAINGAAMEQMIKDAAAHGSCTALYDAIKLSIDDVPKSAKYTDQIKYVVVLTDGGNNHGPTTYEHCKQLIAKPGIANFYFILIGVDLDGDAKTKMIKLCKPNHAHYIDAGSSSADIKRAFATAQKKIREYAEVYIRVRATGQNATRNVAQMLHNVKNAPLTIAPSAPVYQSSKPRLLILK